MFKSYKVQEKPFPLSVNQIQEDIDSLSKDPEQQKKLFVCIDNKIPDENEHRKEVFSGAEALRQVPSSLSEQLKTLEEQSKVIQSNVEEIKRKILQ